MKKPAKKTPSAKKARVRDTPTLDELFRYELKKRSSLEGIAIAARVGDREALKTFAGAAAVCAESATKLLEVRHWLVDALAQIEAGVEPNIAFGWKRRRAGHPSPRQDFEGLKRAWLLAHHVAGILAEQGESSGKAASMIKIYAVVAKSQHASVEQVRVAWEWWTGKRLIAPE